MLTIDSKWAVKMSNVYGSYKCDSQLQFTVESFVVHKLTPNGMKIKQDSVYTVQRLQNRENYHIKSRPAKLCINEILNSLNVVEPYTNIQLQGI